MGAFGPFERLVTFYQSTVQADSNELSVSGDDAVGNVS
jgi:hypothetical protein